MEKKYKMRGLKMDPQQLAGYSSADDQKEYLAPLGKLNIFIGTNNSGKSRLLRGILKTKNPQYLPVDFDYERVRQEATQIVRKSRDVLDQSAFSEISVSGGSDLFQSLSNINPDLGLGGQPDLILSLLGFARNVDLLKTKGSGGSRGAARGEQRYQDVSKVARVLWEIVFVGHGDFLKGLSELKPASFDRLYIPIMRGLRPAVDCPGDIYSRRTVSDYFENSSKSNEYPEVKVFSGLDLYAEIQGRLLGSLADRSFIREYEEYLKEVFFGGAPVTLIPRKGHDVLTVKVGNEKEQKIYDIGDGLQALIVLTFPLFEHFKIRGDSPLIVCIEEPELLVHPGLQRSLVKELVSSPVYSNMQFFLTTHSNHFLDLSLDYEDISIFRLRKDIDNTGDVEAVPKFTVENVSSRDKQTLELLGVKNSSVFLSNATVWVEGITDRMYLRRAFEIWQKENRKTARTFREDAHYAFVEYGGSNLPHWDFVEEEGFSQMSVESITSRIFLVADGDIDDPDSQETSASKKSKRLDAISEKMGDRFCRLESREIENLLTPKVIRAVMAKFGATKDPEDFKQETYKNERLGRFLKDTFAPTKKVDSDYGALANKPHFAGLAIQEMNSGEDLSPEMVSLCERLYRFIEEANRF